MLSAKSSQPLPPHLYKYVPPGRVSFFQDGLLRFTQPGAFNDPFEMRPIFSFESVASSDEIELIANVANSLHKDLPEYLSKKQAEVFAEFYIKENRTKLSNLLNVAEATFGGVFNYKSLPESINATVGILSLAERPDNLLMWAHYAESHSGFVLEFDSSHSFFNQKQSDLDEIRHLRKVRYSKVRPKVDLKRNDSNFTVLLTKPDAWWDEEEWRLILELNKANSVKSDPANPFDVCLFAIPWAAVTGVIFGHRASAEVILEICKLVRGDERLKHIELKAAVMHPKDFGVLIQPYSSFSEMDTDARQIAGAQEAFAKLMLDAECMNNSITPEKTRAVIEKIQRV